MSELRFTDDRIFYWNLFLLFEVQMKSVFDPAIAGASWSRFRESAKKGLGQIVEAVNSGQVTEERFDIMVPEGFEHLADELLDKLRLSLDLDNSDSPYYGIEIIIGTFIE